MIVIIGLTLFALVLLKLRSKLNKALFAEHFHTVGKQCFESDEPLNAQVYLKMLKEHRRW